MTVYVIKRTVIEGDTIVVAGEPLHRIDAPELDQTFRWRASRLRATRSSASARVPLDSLAPHLDANREGLRARLPCPGERLALVDGTSESRRLGAPPVDPLVGTRRVRGELYDLHFLDVWGTPLPQTAQPAEQGASQL